MISINGYFYTNIYKVINQKTYQVLINKETFELELAEVLAWS